jgi:hypothetical protein
MKRTAIVAWALAVVYFVSVGGTLLAQQPQKPQPAAAPAVSKPALSQPMKGTAVISVLKPVTKVKGNEVVTVLTVKNSSYGAIGGLRVDEYWYDKAGNIIGGDSQRMKKLLQPDETYVFELHTPKDPKMNRNSYQFSHINGKVRADSVPKF